MAMSDIRSWLAEIGLDHHAEAFEQAGLAIDDLAHLDDSALCNQLGLAIKEVATLRAALNRQAAESEPSPADGYPGDLAPSALPTFIAHPWAGYAESSHPRERLYWLVDTLENSVRLATALALAEFTTANDGVLPQPVASALRSGITTPMLGTWLRMLRTLSDPTHRPDACPQLLPGIFELTACFDEHCASGDDADETTSLLAMRNALAHGGGFSTNRAEYYRRAHEERLATIVRALREVLGNTDLVAWHEDGFVRLRGVEPAPFDGPTTDLGGRGPWVVGPQNALSLDPLLAFGPVRRRDPDGTLRVLPREAVGQLYTRAQAENLRYTPIGVDEIASEDSEARERLRTVFRLDEAASSSRAPTERSGGTNGYHWAQFLQEAAALPLIGRGDELATLKQWLADHRGDDEPRIGWIAGAPGIGKSQLMARLAADRQDNNALRHQPNSDTALYYHRFRAGDGRNSTLMFLRLLREALDDWDALAEHAPASELAADEGEALVRDVRARLEAIPSIEPPHPKAPARRLVVILDGLDEVARHEPTVTNLIRRLAVPGTVWLVAGRPGGGIEQAFTQPLAEALFADTDGLPGMRHADIRAMIEHGLGHNEARRRLFERDRDTDPDAPPENPFVDAVVRHADGLPIYVELVLADIERGAQQLDREDRLPASLQAYYEELLQRLSIGDIQRDLPLLVAALAVAEEPLTESALCYLAAASHQRDTPDERDGQRTRQVLTAASSLLRTAPTPDADEGYTLYHTSFRDYVLRDESELAESLGDALRQLDGLADRWADLADAALSNHLFRAGNHYALEWARFKNPGEPERQLDHAYHRLTTYAYVHARLVALGAGGVTDLSTDYERLFNQLPDDDERHPVFRLWEAFFRERAHVFRRGREEWPPYKILLQLATEHGDDSPVTQAAEAWLAAGHCNWFWLHTPKRPAKTPIGPCVSVLEHPETVLGQPTATELADGNILTWRTGINWDPVIRIWDPKTGALLGVLEGHTKTINGVLKLNLTNILTYSDDGTLRLWNLETRTCSHTLTGHTDSVTDAHQLDDGRILSSSADGTLRIWDAQKGDMQTILRCHTQPVRGADQLQHGTLVSWSDDATVCLWHPTTGNPIACLRGHHRRIKTIIPLANGTFASATHRTDDPPRIWNSTTGALVATLGGCSGWARGLSHLRNGRLLSWGSGSTLSVWDAEGNQQNSLSTYLDGIAGVLELADGRILGWHKNSLFLWDSTTPDSATSLANHSSAIRGARELSDKSVIFWDQDGGLIRIDSASGQFLDILEGHADSVTDAWELTDGKIVSCAWDDTVRIWSKGTSNGLNPATEAGSAITAAIPIGDRLYATCGNNGTIAICDTSGNPRSRLQLHSDRVNGATRLGDGHLLSWSDDKTLRISHLDSSEGHVALRGHKNRVSGAVECRNCKLISWTFDEIISWDRSGTTLARQPLEKPFERLSELANGALLTIGYDDFRIRSPISCRLIKTLHEGRLNGSSKGGAWQTDDGKIWTFLSNGRVDAWNEQGDHLQTAMLPAPADKACTLEGGDILVACRDRSVRILMLGDNITYTELGTHSDVIVDVVPLSPHVAVSWCWGGTLRVWDTIQRIGLRTLNIPGHEKVKRLETLGGGAVLCVGESTIVGWKDILEGSNEPSFYCQFHTTSLNEIIVTDNLDSAILESQGDNQLYPLALYKGAKSLGFREAIASSDGLPE
jgi:WD40 repeat protein